jgi:probable rRNA maturation factor
MKPNPPIITNNPTNAPLPFLIEPYIQSICLHLKINVQHIEVTLLPIKEIQQMNLEYFKKNTPTDTISFNLTPEEAITGDIYINLDTIQTNAMQYKQPLEKELKLVLIHSILHLIGFTDDTTEAIKKMTDKQTMLLQLLP